jgi:streptogramin lyase
VVDNQGHIFVTDPEAFRVLEFTVNGSFIRTWGEYGIGAENFGLAAAIAVDTEGHVWVSDAVNNRLMRFTMP